MITTPFADILHCAEASGFSVDKTTNTIRKPNCSDKELTERMQKFVKLLDMFYSEQYACACPNTVSENDNAFEQWWQKDLFDTLDIDTANVVDDTPIKFYTRAAWEAARRYYEHSK
jgi:hypothetical protein